MLLRRGTASLKLRSQTPYRDGPFWPGEEDFKNKLVETKATDTPILSI